MFDSTYIIAKRQFDKAQELLNKPKNDQLKLEGPVGSVFQWIDMTKQQISLNEDDDQGRQLQKTVRTCPAAMGYSFAAGTTDGPGEFDFTQGTNTSNPFWDFVSGLLKDPSPEQEACHAPKPILLDTGEINLPFKVYKCGYM